MITSQSLNTSLFLSTLLAASMTAQAEDWANWRGPNRNGISQETGWTAQWPEGGPKKLWEATVGTGFATLAVSQGRVFTMGNTADTDTIYCLDANTGAVKWKVSYPCKLDPNAFEGGPCSTPTVVDGKVYTFSRFGQIYALNATDGKELWQKNLMEELGVKRPSWGFAGSVTVEGDLLILNLGGAGTALDKATGKVVWTSNKEAGGYSTPYPFDYEGKRAVALFSAKSVVAVAMADGKKLWEFEWKTSYDVNAADPIISGDKVFISSGYGRGCALLQVKGNQVTKLWENKNMKNHYENCVLFNGNLYGFDGQAGSANLTCLELETGAVKWSQSGLSSGGLLVADGKLILLADGGKLVVAEASPAGFKQLAAAQPLTGKCWTMPVLANGRIFCRNNKAGQVVCLDVSGK